MVGSLAYFGTFNVDEAERTIIFRTVGSTFPHAEGEVIKRVVSRISAEEFTYANPSTTTGAGIEATWRRVK